MAITTPNAIAIIAISESTVRNIPFKLEIDASLPLAFARE